MSPELLPVKFVLQSQVIPPQQWAVSSVCLSFGLVNETGACVPLPNCCLGTLNYLTGDLRAAVI